MIKNIRSLFELEKETKPIKDKIISNIKKFFEQEEGYCKPIRVGNFYSSNYIGHENSGDRDRKSTDWRIF